jgi:hypothetical protein
MQTKTVETRIPAFLWESLKDVFYEQDNDFLRLIAPHIGVSHSEIRKAIFGARGERTTIAVAESDAWWEGECCPIRVRSPITGFWRSCGNLREAHGFCGEHRGFKGARSDVRHQNDTYFRWIEHRRPARYDGETVWVGRRGDVVCEDGSRIPNIAIRDGVVYEGEAAVELMSAPTRSRSVSPFPQPAHTQPTHLAPLHAEEGHT